AGLIAVRAKRLVRPLAERRIGPARERPPAWRRHTRPTWPTLAGRRLTGAWGGAPPARAVRVRAVGQRGLRRTAARHHGRAVPGHGWRDARKRCWRNGRSPWLHGHRRGRPAVARRGHGPRRRSHGRTRHRRKRILRAR